MLWLKGFLETRARFVFSVLWSAGLLVVLRLMLTFLPARPEAQNAGAIVLTVMMSMLAFASVFVFAYLAGTGIKTQSGMSTSPKGLHGSTQFTLALPVSRARLMGVRTALGLCESAAVAVMLFVAAAILFPEMTARSVGVDPLLHLMAVCACGFAFHGLGVLIASIVEEGFITPIITINIITIVWGLHLFTQIGGKALVPPALDIFRPLVVESPLVTHMFPWAPVIVAIVLGCAFLFAALQIVQRQEY